MVDVASIAELIDGVAGAVSPIVGSSNPFNLAADPDSDLPVVRQLQQVQRGVCDAWASNPGGIAGQDLGVNSYMASACGDYLNDKGTPVPSPPTDPNFSGGQCPGVGYTVVVEVKDRVRNFPSDPWTERTLYSTPQSRVGAIGGVIRKFNSAQGAFQVALVSNSGATETFVGLGWDDNSPTYEFIQAKVASIVRNDGLPDDCGDRPNFPGSPIGSPINQPGVPGNPWLKEPWRILPPYRDGDDNWHIPVEFPGLPPIEVLPPSLSPTGGLNGGNDGSAPGNFGDPYDPDEGGNPEEFDADLWGVRVECFEISNLGQIVGVNPVLSPRILGNIVFWSETPVGMYAYPPIQIRSASQLVQVPNLARGVRAVGYQKLPLTNWIITPIFRQE